MKYEEHIRFDFANTMSIIAPLIKKGSTVLEFGPASGRLTKYLKEQKKCKIYIVEIDAEAGAIASKYAEKSIIDDILNFQWEKEFGSVSFDYILFADVLEHLIKPEMVLQKCKTLLKDQGKIIISIPNIAHNSVIIDLLNNKFEYQETGLLDNTHVRFWSYDSIGTMLNSLGLFIEERWATYSQVGLNEFDNSYDDVPEEVSVFLKTRENGELYQYILSVTKQLVQETKDMLLDKRDYFYSQIFLDDGENIEECPNLKQNIVLKGKKYIFNIENKDNSVKLRFDPLNRACVIRLHCKAKKHGQNGIEELLPESSNSSYHEDGIFWFETDDPQVYFIIQDMNEIQIELEVREFFTPNATLKKLLQWENISQQKENYINEQRASISQKDEIIKQKENEIVLQKQNIDRIALELQEKERCIQKYERFVAKGIAGFLYKSFLKREKK